ncbi:hypothetical protein BDN70DRAFT_665688 [Pholiota conissans]|uniref:Uncharacterized protein n=1 Tax=Pholiota conissans TaxID=109636 RepID=A0A9P5YIS1_9AGAR|nr:hypothetical protein BDN70DRAFT_665688 [Pholiota conissans]
MRLTLPSRIYQTSHPCDTVCIPHHDCKLSDLASAIRCPAHYSHAPNLAPVLLSSHPRPCLRSRRSSLSRLTPSPSIPIHPRPPHLQWRRQVRSTNAVVHIQRQLTRAFHAHYRPQTPAPTAANTHRRCPVLSHPIHIKSADVNCNRIGRRANVQGDTNGTGSEIVVVSDNEQRRTDAYADTELT